MRSNNAENLKKYLARLHGLFQAREIAIEQIIQQTQQVVKNFVSVEKQLYQSSIELRKLAKKSDFKKGKSAKVKVVPGAGDRIKIRKPELHINDGNVSERVDLPLTKAEASRTARKFCSPTSREMVAVKLLQVGQLSDLYDQSRQPLLRIARILGVEARSSGEPGRGYDDFLKRRQSFLDSVMQSLVDEYVRYKKGIEYLADPIFEFNSIGGSKRGYKGLSLSWDVPRNEEIEPGLYCQNQLTFKYIAFNLKGAHITRPLSSLDSSSQHTIRPTRRVIKELGIDRFRRPILEWMGQYYRYIPECHDSLNKFARIEEVITDV